MELTKSFVNHCRKVAALRDFLCQAMDQVDEKEAQLNHANYKRCLAMADFCESQYDYYNTLGNGFWLVRGDVKKRDEYRKKSSDFWWKWHKRWLELAKKFKEAK